ncbi:helix-turn-helix domain-containing protein [Agromyces sp. Soil535]|uniref:winged helix-turn-helix transcriptional regulator n=1 Tax=Agromyces sp. Soil535 TaxID=1736390 RepID=UPI0006FD76AD|nr:helix-turn-helix domain-containing protein [Agromyces sp. Soil535]KRE21822.1 HxlR family transcriptional regulator [Agromyces sp. Soil535]
MRQTSFADMHCSIARSLEVIGDWWSPLIIRDVYLGLDRFDDLAADLGISRGLLADRLETLVAGGVLCKVPYSSRPVRHHYRLTEAGTELVPLLIALTAWGDRWRSDGVPPILFEHDVCGAHLEAHVTCASCGGEVLAGEVTPRPGPGGRIARGTMLIGRVLGAEEPHDEEVRA